MLISAKDLDYMNKIVNKMIKGEPIIRRENSDDPGLDSRELGYCPECDADIEYWDQIHLILQNGDIDNPIIMICCEGYHPLNAS